jgi:flagellar basal body-associated protein FliL
VIIAKLFRRPGDKTESSQLANQLIDMISDDMKPEQIKTAGDVITSVLRRIKEERQTKAAEYEKEQAEKRRKGDEASKSVGGSVERRKSNNASQKSKQAKHKGGTKKVFALVAVVLLIAAIGSGWFYYQHQSSGSDVAKQQKPTKRKNVVYCDFPKVTVVLKNSPTSSVKPVVHSAIIQIAAEFDDVTVLPICKTAQTRVLDSMQGLLRNITFEELQGQEGTERLRVNIVKIVNREIGFKDAEAVLFKQILIQ